MAHNQVPHLGRVDVAAGAVDAHGLVEELDLRGGGKTRGGEWTTGWMSQTGLEENK